MGNVKFKKKKNKIFVMNMLDFCWQCFQFVELFFIVWITLKIINASLLIDGIFGNVFRNAWKTKWKSGHWSLFLINCSWKILLSNPLHFRIALESICQFEDKSRRVNKVFPLNFCGHTMIKNLLLKVYWFLWYRWIRISVVCFRFVEFIVITLKELIEKKNLTTTSKYVEVNLYCSVDRIVSKIEYSKC